MDVEHQEAGSGRRAAGGAYHAHVGRSSFAVRHSSFVLNHGLPLSLYAILSIVLTWPLALYLSTANPAPPGDTAQDLWEKLWNLWWTVEALRRGVNPLFSDTIFYPKGASLLFHPLSLPSGWLVAPITVTAGPVLAYNVIVLLSFVLSGYVVYLLTRRHGCGRAAALIGGLTFTASSFHITHIRLSHLELMPIQWLPLYVLALDHLLERGLGVGGWGSEPTAGENRELLQKLLQKEAQTATRETKTERSPRIIGFPKPKTLNPIPPLAVALVLLLLVFTSLYLAIYAAILTAVLVAWFVGAALLRGERRALVPPLVAFGAAMLVVGAIVVPVQLLPMQREASDPRNVGYAVRSISEAASRAAAPADIVLPPPYATLRAVLPLPATLSNGSFVGYVALALALVAAATRPRIAGRWVALAIIAWLLSLGPDYPFYRALYNLPGFQFGRYPDRFGLLAILAVSVLAAVGADALLKTKDEGRTTKVQQPAVKAFVLGRSSFVSVGLFLLVLLELYPGSSPLTFPLKSPYYDKLAQDGETYSVLELPITRLNSAWLAMYGQTQHRHPILDGALARQVPHLPFADMPVIREIEHPEIRDIVVQSPDARRAALSYFNLGKILFHRSDQSGPVKPPSAAQIAQVTGVPVMQVYADGEFVAYQLEPTAAPPLLPAIIALDTGWNKLEASGPDAHRWLKPEGGAIELTAPQAGTLALHLALLAYKQPQKLTLYLDDQPVATLDVPPWKTELVTPPFAVRAGAHTLRLVPSDPGVTPREAGDGADDRRLTVGVWSMEIVAQ